MNNPLLSSYNTYRETIPFAQIKFEHYEPAILQGIQDEEQEIDAIVENAEAPSFDNTILALEHSGELLENVTNVFFNLLSAESNDDMQNLAQKVAPILSEHSNNILLNEKLFKRVQAVYAMRENLELDLEDARLLEKTMKSFTRNGANLAGEAKERYRQLSTELSVLTLKYSDNLLKEVNTYRLQVTDGAKLEGVPAHVLEEAQVLAKREEKEGWLFTMQAPSYLPFMQHVPDRALREQMHAAFRSKASKGETSNIELVQAIANKRLEKAQLLGYKSHADYVLENRMAKSQEKVQELLAQLIVAYTPKGKKEIEELQAFAQESEGADFVLMPWDYAYYAEKLKESRYAINDELLRPYFSLDNVKSGVFGLAEKLYGITFKKNTEIETFHPDVDAYEVFDQDGSFLSILYTDFHPREGKRAGAWMTSFREQHMTSSPDGQVDQRPHVMIVMNFTKPTASQPALLSYQEVETFLHEFGHSLHGMFARSKYGSLSGTNVRWDFVELPSQIMENFITEKAFLDTFAHHYKTGEAIPTEYIQRIKDAANFNAGYACLRQVSFGILDMAWYSRTTPFEGDVIQYDHSAMEEVALFPTQDDACMSTQFSHIFAGGYSAGYYSYKWAEVLDADAFTRFKEEGILNKDVAADFRREVLSKGDTEDPMTLYVRFRGQQPSIKALLKRNGIQ